MEVFSNQKLLDEWTQLFTWWDQFFGFYHSTRSKWVWTKPRCLVSMFVWKMNQHSGVLPREFISPHHWWFESSTHLSVAVRQVEESRAPAQVTDISVSVIVGLQLQKNLGQCYRLCQLSMREKLWEQESIPVNLLPPKHSALPRMVRRVPTIWIMFLRKILQTLGEKRSEGTVECDLAFEQEIFCRILTPLD